MIVALDTAVQRAITGPAAPTGSEATSERYECLFCGASLRYTGGAGTGTELVEAFEHEGRHDDCCANANASQWHRLGEELVAKTLFNWLPGASRAIQIDVERRIGTASEFVIADIRVTSPIQLAVEIVYLNPKLDLRRRLQTLFEQGYAAMVVLLTNGTFSPAKLERSLTRIGTIEIGRVDPHAARVQFGSVITPERVSLESSRWAAMPAYLA